MIILDTDVVSALMRPTPEAILVDWLDSQPAESIWLSSIGIFEIRLGIACLDDGKRRTALETAFARLHNVVIEKRILDFDRAAAEQAAALAAERRRTGRPGDMRDTQIAGIALARRAAIATRNTRHFGGLSVPVINPWQHPA